MVSTGDFALISMLDEIIDALKVRHDYRGIQRLLGTLFGEVGTNGTAGAERHNGGGR